ncbi:hypothetical protein B1992_02555 [Pseudoxanthomonas broegbernensis]|uniref:Uncharacterized protein n=1 Tax=Pseudoxanthomonas broegbernensis TaxID=83619 RepID=A0A7V8GPA5_9GAMM|nr:hypothetical protein [Pseudoxanthomonas broegbernensis]KAF1687564.1 hypothetical protein B1992_02555 [Pseudoxanthomonas broegbernensis]MBB6064576.1 hypothetical protein [Pseudoxanthomonas broegbernensis]
MHAEAQRGSRLNATEYALAHHLLVRRMRREARKFRNALQVDDWRDLMHPNVRNGVRPAAQIRQELRQVDPRPNRPSDSDPVAPLVQGQRCRFTEAKKLANVAERHPLESDLVAIRMLDTRKGRGPRPPTPSRPPMLVRTGLHAILGSILGLSLRQKTQIS